MIRAGLLALILAGGTAARATAQADTTRRDTTAVRDTAAVPDTTQRDTAAVLLPTFAAPLAPGPLPRGSRYTFTTDSLLLTNGLEFRIRFSNLRLRWFGRVLLASSKPSEIEKEWADDDQLAAT